MDFTLDDDQRGLRESLRRLLTRVDAASPLDRGQRHDVWVQLAGMGLLDLAPAGRPDALGPVEVMLVAEELGRTRVRMPFSEVLVTACLIAELGSAAQREDWLPAAAAGTQLVVLAHSEPRAPAGLAAYAVVAAPDGDGWRLTGTKEPVPYAGHATAFLVSAVVDGATRLFLVPKDAAGVTVTAYDTHDHAGAGRVDLAGAPAVPLGEGTPGDVAAALRRAFAAGCAALCAEAVGALDVALWTTVEYLRSRRQFGVPLRTFQALQHRAADMFIEVEMARSITAYAAIVRAESPGEAELAAARAKVQVGRSARFVSQNAIQLHGGIGITDEHPIGHFASRLEAIEHAFGGVDVHLAVLARALDPAAPVELLA